LTNILALGQSHEMANTLQTKELEK